MMFFSFPTGKQPEDTSESLVLLARFFALFAVFSLFWGAVRVPSWIDALQCQATTMGVVVDHMPTPQGINRSYQYTVNGTKYSAFIPSVSERPLGLLPALGPVKVFYNANAPGRSVLNRRPSLNLCLAVVTAIGAFLLARQLWKMGAD